MYRSCEVKWDIGPNANSFNPLYSMSYLASHPNEKHGERHQHQEVQRLIHHHAHDLQVALAVKKCSLCAPFVKRETSSVKRNQPRITFHAHHTIVDQNSLCPATHPTCVAAHGKNVSCHTAHKPILVYNMDVKREPQLRITFHASRITLQNRGHTMHPRSRKDPLSGRIALLKNVPLFADLREKDLAVLADDFRLREYDKGEIIFHQGDHGHELYIVVRGKVRIFKTSPSGNETSINIFSTYDFIGEFATIDSQPRSATAKAIERCAVLEMTQDRFLQHMREIPDLAIEMTRLLASKVRWTAAYAETIAQFDAAGRLLHILLFYNEQFGQEIEAGKRYILDLSLNQAGLASLVGARREWINRILRDWRKRGLVEYEAGRITILDLPAVERERDGRIEAVRGGMEW